MACYDTKDNSASVSLECRVRIDDAVKGYINFYNAGISSHAVIGSCNRYDLDMHRSCGQLLTKYAGHWRPAATEDLV